MARKGVIVGQIRRNPRNGKRFQVLRMPVIGVHQFVVLDPLDRQKGEHTSPRVRLDRFMDWQVVNG